VSALTPASDRTVGAGCDDRAVGSAGSGTVGGTGSDTGDGADGPRDGAPERARLEAERLRVLERLALLTHDFDEVVAASLDTNADDEHDPEGHTIAFERSQVSALVEQVGRHLAAVDAALARVEAGTYGTCVGCGGAIGAARLEARPVAATCISCASRG
jgi:RNA polymerase-binding transcription factor DksA